MESPRKGIGYALLQGANLMTGLAGLGVAHLDGRVKLRLNVKYRYRQRPDDIFVVSYPKSGTTLLQMMLYQLKSDGEMDFPHIDSVCPWFEFRLVRTNSGPYLESLPSPRVFKSHLFYQHVPKGVKSIFLARDPRDVAVSAYHHFRLVTGQDLELTPFVSAFLNDRSIFRSWFKHLQSWWPHRNDPNVLFLRYEEVVADLPGTVRRVAAFSGLPLDEARLARVVERCSFPFMKQYDAKFDPRLTQVSRTEREFIRKGTSGGGGEVFNPAQQQLLNRRLAATAKKLGCSPEDLLTPPALKSRAG